MDVWRTGEAARRAGSTVHALRHYEELELLRPRRSPSGQRLYGEQDVARVRFVRRAAALGFSLGEIAEILRLRDGGQLPCGWVRERLSEKAAAIEARIGELERLRAELLALRDGPAEDPRAACCPLLERGGRRGARRGPAPGSDMAAGTPSPQLRPNRPPTRAAVRRPPPPGSATRS